MKKFFFAVPVIAAIIVIGCSTTPPTALEQKLFTINTNYFPQLVTVTNTTFRTNVVVETVTTTNKVGVIVTEPFTNFITVPLTQITTQITQIPAYTYAPGPGGDAAKGVAGTIGNLVAPGVGGPIATGVVGLGLALWSWIRGSKQSATANNLSQAIEVARELIKSLPNGSAIDSTYTSWLAQHQAEAGVLPQVLDILEKTTDNPAAKQTADQLRAALAALQNPSAPKV